jgi:hypothetical protein
MKKQILSLLCLCIPFLCIAQNLPREYEYDNAGNRTARKYISMVFAPPAPSFGGDSIAVEVSQTPVCYTEIIERVEIKIYPNPTTEKITLEISNMETLQTGIFKLYSMSGQLLQERPVYSSTTEISLAGLARGTYILKVQINDTTEDWKIIKQ